MTDNYDDSRDAADGAQAPEWSRAGRAVCHCCGRTRVLYVRPHSTDMVCRRCIPQMDAGCTTNCYPDVGAHDAKCARAGASRD